MTPEEMADWVEQLNRDVPFRQENRRLIEAIEEVHEASNALLKRWRIEYLSTADPTAADPDGYAKPLITAAELMRRMGLRGLSGGAYAWGIRLIRDHMTDTGKRLHLGAVYTNYGISHLEAQRYHEGLAWLLAAAQEDLENRGVRDPLGSYAWSDEGVFGQFFRSRVLPQIPADVTAFLDQHLGRRPGEKELFEVFRWSAGEGDVNLLSGILDYARVAGQDDAHSDSVRFNCLRDLATLFEVVWKRIGRRHTDPAVRSRFAKPPTLAGLICHMHFGDDRKARRAAAAPSTNFRKGLLWNDVHQSVELLHAVDSEVDYCAGDEHSVEDVWNRLRAFPAAPTPLAREVSRRFLLSYKLRNVTSHSFQPQDPGVKRHHAELRVWLLQSIFFLYRWAKQTGQLT